MKHSLKFQDIEECLKLELVSEAETDLAERRTKSTQSRLSILTGLRRREITRITSGNIRLDSPRNLITKVLGRWQDQEEPKKGKPKILKISKEYDEFAELVANVSCDLNPATVLFELERVGAVKRTANGLQRIQPNYIPLDDAKSGFEILAHDLADMTEAVEANVTGGEAPPPPPSPHRVR